MNDILDRRLKELGDSKEGTLKECSHQFLTQGGTADTWVENKMMMMTMMIQMIKVPDPNEISGNDTEEVDQALKECTGRHYFRGFQNHFGRDAHVGFLECQAAFWQVSNTPDVVGMASNASGAA